MKYFRVSSWCCGWSSHRTIVALASYRTVQAVKCMQSTFNAITRIAMTSVRTLITTSSFRRVVLQLSWLEIQRQFLLQELVITHIELVINSLLYEYMGIQFHDQQSSFLNSEVIIIEHSIFFGSFMKIYY